MSTEEPNPKPTDSEPLWEPPVWGPGDSSTPASPAPQGAKQPMSKRTKIAAGAGALVLIVGGSFGAYEATNSSGGSTKSTLSGLATAQSGAGASPATFGTVTSVNGSTLVISGTDGADTTVKTSGSTTITTTATGTFSDLKVGDNVTVRSSSTDSSATTVDATAITDSGTLSVANLGTGGGRGYGGTPPSGAGNGGTPPAGMTPPDGTSGQAGTGGAMGFGNRVSGAIKSISGTTVTVANTDGTTYTVNTSSSTTYSVTKKAALSDIKQGQSVTVQGTTATDGTITATSIREGATRTGTGTRGTGSGTGTGTGATTSPA